MRAQVTGSFAKEEHEPLESVSEDGHDILWREWRSSWRAPASGAAAI
jgi:hypothetical protein